MPDGLTLLLACACSVVAMAWFALAMDIHWKQVQGSTERTWQQPPVLRVMAWLALTASLLLCLRVDHASMAALVWIMSLAVSVVLIAQVLAWRPRLLALLALRRG